MSILAKDITDCSDCPLYQNTCQGRPTADSNGNIVEPPCAEWTDDTEVY